MGYDPGCLKEESAKKGFGVGCLSLLKISLIFPKIFEVDIFSRE